jgi:hypothetical protein
MGFILTVEMSPVFAVFFFGLLFHHENGGDMFFRNIGFFFRTVRHSPVYIHGRENLKTSLGARDGQGI